MGKSYNHIRRVFYIDQQIREQKYPNCTTVANAWEVNRRTIQDDIDYMRYQLGAPLEFDKKKNGYYYSEENYYLPNYFLTQSELFALMVFEKILKQYKNTPYYDELSRIFKKAMDYLPDTHLPEDTHTPFTFEQRPSLPVEKQKLKLLQEAATKKLKVHITHYSPQKNETTCRLVDPYYIVNHHGNWYLIAHCHLRKDERTFAVGRISEIKITDSKFKKRKNFSLRRYRAESFDLERGKECYQVKLKFSPYQARWIREREWHPSQKIEETGDGHLILAMKVKGLNDLKRWVLYHGAEVEVIEPPILRELVQLEIEKMRKIYRDS